MKRKISEMISSWKTSLRWLMPSFSYSFWGGSSRRDVSKVDMARARAMYRNDNANSNLGSGFARPIIDNTVDFVGLPRAIGDNEQLNEVCNRSISAWAAQIQEIIRNACRDSRTIVRIRRADTDNPLVTRDEADLCYLQAITPEVVELFYSQTDETRLVEAIIEHEIEVIIEPEEVSGASFVRPRTEVHTILEIINESEFRYYDQTSNEWVDDLRQNNDWGFIPLLEVFNEYDDYLHEGQSDLEGPYPFIMAFHEVMEQALQAHKYHSIPKAKFRLNDVESFLMNNFPDSFEKDEFNQAIPNTFNGNVSWTGREIIFVKAEEDVGFIEAHSVLGDSKTLLEFLLDCICIASETPEWAFMRVEGAPEGAQTAQSLPFSRKIERKRNMFAPYIQVLFKMLLKIQAMPPVRVPLEWSEIDPQAAVTKSQSMQQEAMAVDLMHQKSLISDSTALARMRQHFPEIKSTQQELDAAKNNRVLLATNPNAVPKNGNQPTTVPGGPQGANE